MKHIVPAVSIIFFFSLRLIADTPIDRVDAYLNKAAKNKYAGSVLVAVDGKVLLKKGYGFADPEKQIAFQADTVFDIGSVTKQFTAAAILKLESEKKLSVEDPISKYFSNSPKDKKEITIHHLLTHSAGLPDALGEDEEYIDRESYIKKTLETPLIHTPGKYDYSNVGYSLLAAIVEIISGKDYEKFLDENFFRPFQMHSTGYVMPKWDAEKIAVGYRNGKRWGTTIEKSQYKEKGVTWHLKGNGGIFSTIEDMHKWCEALRTNQVFAGSVTQKLFHTHVPEDEDASSYYGYGWTIQENKRGEKVISHNGGNGFYMDTVVLIPSRNAVLIASSTNAPKNTDVITERIDRLMFENLKSLEDLWISQHTGTYELPSGTKFRVDFNENDGAVAHLNNSESFLLLGRNNSDDPEKAKEMNTQTTSFLHLVQMNETTKIEDEELASMYKSLRENLGTVKKFEILGSVSRRAGEYYLTQAKLTTDKGEFYRLFIWKSGKAFDLRELPDGYNLEFSHQSGEDFYSEVNDLKIHFTKINNNPAMVIHSKPREINALKTKN